MEEAGLRLCAKVENIVNVSPGWEEFCNGCYLPDTDNLEYVFRAITPPEDQGDLMHVFLSVELRMCMET